MPLFDNIKMLARKRGMSLAELNNKAGLKANIIYSWKNKTPSVDKLESVARVLGVSVDYLLDKDDNLPASNMPKKIDITDENIIMTYEGKPIPPEDLEIMKRFLNGGKRDGNNQ